MRNKKFLLLEQLDRKSELLNEIAKQNPPVTGWINTVRTSLNMTLLQLAKKLNISAQGVKDIEKREAEGAISIKSLKEVAKALDMQLVYGFVSNKGSFNNFVDYKAKELASKIVMRTHQTMKLENQGNREEIIQKAIEDLAKEIKQEMRRTLWD